MRALYLSLSAPIAAAALLAAWIIHPDARYTIGSSLQLFAALIIGHVIADYPLQGDFLARAKNRSNPIPGVPWYQALGAHALIHGGTVWLMTGYWWLGALEVGCHALIDDTKCRSAIGFNADQVLHVLCKAIWAAIAIAAISH
ncbi:DUF3307 domain-containing protein [Paraburkholderia sp. SARCC-3016]|uniref:DUF3307 domain-containing protein n=1 Tax=Paraburkholderia sp. SARCC-3016 TaxID=3058611 RepID=UPI0028067C1A|nr:DUF3307 domain-containing protein [Paraburkholderia sp. SARCC-3016]MDQ7981939.1 DUF3307 domain-containing protein [Paraburkholderia sp. SARCC-3016]